MALGVKQTDGKFSLGFILAISLAGLQFIAILFVVLSSYLTSERAILSHARDLMEGVGDNTVEHTRGFLEPASEITARASRAITNGLIAADDYDSMERYFFELLQTKPQIEGIYFGDEAGNFVYVMKSSGPAPFRTKVITINDNTRQIDFIWRSENYQVVARDSDPADTFDARGRPWYVKARQQNRRIWTDPYIFFSSQQPGITVAEPVGSRDNAILGVIGVDIKISAISDFLSNLNVGKTGAAMILGADGSLLAHPDPSQIHVKNGDGSLSFANVADIDDPISRAAFATYEVTPLDGASSQANFKYLNQSYLGLFTPLQEIELPWTIAVYAPEDDFIGGIKANRARNIWIAAAISVLTALVGLALAERILRPVRAFAVRTALVSQGEVSPSAPLPETYRELRKANETLIDQIAQRRASNAKVQELSRDLAHFSRVSVMGQMASGLAHELSRPLTAISQNVDAAISTAKQDPKPNDDLIAILNELDEQAHQGGDVLRALRSIVKKDDGDATAFRFVDLLDQTKRLMSHELEGNSVQLIYEQTNDEIVRGNRVQIAQVLLNLFRNAIDAMVSSNSKVRQISVVTNVNDGFLNVRVEDTGPGVADGVKLFKQFQTSKDDGMGLGLSISRTIMEANGGRLWHDTASNGDTAFCFTIPYEAN